MDLLQLLRKMNVSRATRWHEGAEPWSGADWSNAMQGEAGEAGNVVKKLRRQETGTLGNVKDPDREALLAKLGEEIADTLIYADLLANHYGIDLPYEIRKKFDAVSAREGFPERLTPTPEEITAHHSVGSAHGFCNHGELPGQCDQVSIRIDVA